MKTDAYTQNIEKSLAAYESLQAEHLTLLGKEQMPDIAGMTEARKSSFATLKYHMDELLANAGRMGQKGLKILNRYEKRLNAVMSRDKAIALEIVRHKKILTQSLKHIKQGKAAMAGYKPAQSASNAPSVLSLNR